jgi:hypothetical protein
MAEVVEPAERFESVEVAGVLEPVEPTAGLQPAALAESPASSARSESAEEVIAHVVLFRPRPDVTPDDRRAFVAALEDAFRNVPAIRRAVVGRALPGDNGVDFPYVAIIEFDDERGFQSYLAHPLHRPVARLFHHTCAATTIVNAQMTDAREPLSGLLAGH